VKEEKEIKIKILDNISVNEVKKIVEDLFKITFNKFTLDKDVYYDYDDNFYFNHNHGLRIRNEQEIAYKVLFYLPEKKPNPWFVLEKEYDLPVFEKDLLDLFNLANIKCDLLLPKKINLVQLKEILRKLNFTEKIVIEKERLTGSNEHYTLCLDNVKNLGLFLEIEVKDDHDLDNFRNKIPFKYEEIRHGYTNLYAKDILKLTVPNFKEKFIENPDWNYFGNQKEIIYKITTTK
jgi:adenylate cyclase class IV